MCHSALGGLKTNPITGSLPRATLRTRTLDSVQKVDGASEMILPPTLWAARSSTLIVTVTA